MAAPQRKAAWGTEASLLEDLRLARDAGGIARSGAERLAQFGVLPVYGLDRLRALGITSFAEQSVEWLLARHQG